MNCVIYLLFLLFAIQAFAENNDGWFTHYVQAEEAYAQKNYQLAIEEYTKVIELASEQLCLYVARGKTYEKMNKYEEALHDFSFIINYPNVHHKDLISALQARARIYLMLSNYENMYKDYDALTAIAQNTPEIEINRKYSTLKNINSSRITVPGFQEQHASEMIQRNDCPSEKEIVFTDKGVVLIDSECQTYHKIEAENSTY